MVKVDNGSPRAVGAALKNVYKTWGQIPGYPEYKAVTYLISPSVGGSGGMYSATASFPFMMYHFGSRASAFQILSCPCNAESHVTTYYYSYASPGGASLFNKDIA